MPWGQSNISDLDTGLVATQTELRGMEKQLNTVNQAASSIGARLEASQCLEFNA